ncbi:hypothetical protein GBAR_LOCUS15581, partial [Geodia barretti]
MFCMKAGFLYVEVSFSKQDKRRRVVLAKYIDIFAGTFGFWLFGYAVSGNTDQGAVGEEQDYIFWFFRVSRQHLTFSYHYTHNDTHTHTICPCLKCDHTVYSAEGTNYHATLQACIPSTLTILM